MLDVEYRVMVIGKAKIQLYIFKNMLNILMVIDIATIKLYILKSILNVSIYAK